MIINELLQNQRWNQFQSSADQDRQDNYQNPLTARCQDFQQLPAGCLAQSTGRESSITHPTPPFPELMFAILC